MLRIPKRISCLIHEDHSLYNHPTCVSSPLLSKDFPLKVDSPRSKGLSETQFTTQSECPVSLRLPILVGLPCTLDLLRLARVKSPVLYVEDKTVNTLSYQQVGGTKTPQIPGISNYC